MSVVRINQVTNLTLNPRVKKAAKQYRKKTGKTISVLTSELLEKFLRAHGFMGDGVAASTKKEKHA